MSRSATKKELAAIAGYTYRRLHDIDLALPEDKKLFVESEDGKYDLVIFVKRWVDYNVEKVTDGDLSLDDVKAKHEQVKMEKSTLEVAKMRGELVDVNDVRRLWGNIANTVVQNMIRLPMKIAPQVVMMDNVEKITGIIDKEIRDTLNVIADTPLPENASKGAEDGDGDEE